VIVSLNRPVPSQLANIIGEFDYSHPVFDGIAIRAQKEVAELQGRQHSYFCGAWTGYGFHEDGLKSGLDVAQQLLRDCAGATP